MIECIRKLIKEDCLTFPSGDFNLKESTRESKMKVTVKQSSNHVLVIRIPPSGGAHLKIVKDICGTKKILRLLSVDF